MRARLVGRIAGGLALLAVLSLGIWQCAQDEIAGSAVSGLQLALHLTGPSQSAVDSVEIELLRGGTTAAGDTVAVSGGSFSATLVATAGGGYVLQVYGKGSGAGFEPGTTARGVVAYGAENGITLRPGRVEDARVDVGPAESQVIHVQGAAGYDTLRVIWTSVEGASLYTLGWHTGEAGTAGSHPAIADTVVTLTWAETGIDTPGAGTTDSVYFRVRPEFAARRGVFGPDYMVDLSVWIDLPRLTGIFPGTGVTVEHDTASVWLGFDRPMDMTTLAEGVIWNDVTHDKAVQFTIERLQPGGSRYRVAPEAGALAFASEYEVDILTSVTDTLGRRFDASPTLPGLQAAGVRWYTAPYDPLRVVAVIPDAGTAGVDPTAPVRLILNRAIDAATLSDATCFLTDPEGVPMPGEPDTAAAADTILWWPDPELWFETQYTIHATSGLCDRRGRPLDDNPETYPALEPFTSFFTTALQPEGPIVTSIVPADGQRAVAPHALVRIIFSEPMDPTTVRVPQTFKVLQNGIAARQGTLAVDATQKIYTFTPNTPFDLSTRYVVQATSAITNQAGVRLDQDRDLQGYNDFRSEFHTEGPLSVASSIPVQGAGRADIAAPLQLTFSGEIDPQTINAASVRLLRGTTAVSCARAVAQDSLVLTVTPDSALAYLTAYRLIADTLVTAVDGSRLDQVPGASGKQPFELAFTTEPESINPHVAVVVPADSAMEVALSVQPEVTFSEPIDPASVRSNTLYLSRIISAQQKEAVPGTISVAGDHLSARFAPQSALLNGTVYELRATSLITSQYGFRLDQEPGTAGFQDFTSTFTVVPERIAPRVNDSNPRNNTTNISLIQPVQVLFSEPMNAASLPGAFSLATGGVTVAGAGSLDEDGELWTFTLAETLAWNTDYTIRVDTTATDLASNMLDQNAVMQGRQAFSATFTTVADSVAPRVTAMDPANGSAGVSVDPAHALRVTFSEELEPGSVGAASFRVTKAGAAVSGQALLTEGGRIISWTPADSLAYGTTYAVTADTLLTDAAHNGLDQNPSAPGRQAFGATFTTEVETLAPRVLSSSPAAGAAGVAVGSAIAVQFSEAMKSNTVAGAFQLTAGGFPWAGSGTLSAGGTDWTFVPAQVLAYSTAYVFQVDSTAQDLSGNLLDQDRSAPHHQIFSAGFTTEADTYAPAVVSMVPDSGSTDVGVLDTLRVTFSEVLAAGSVGPASFRVKLDGGGTVAGTLQIESGGTVVAWAPADSLDFETDYVLVADTQITDAVGNHLDQDPATGGLQAFTGPFRTHIENIPPRVRMVVPANGDANVAIDEVVTIEFSEPMAEASLPAAFALRAGAAAVAGAGDLDPSGMVWTFTPTGSLERSTVYTVSVDTTAVDLAGNALDQDPATAHCQPFSSTFTTVLDVTAPRVAATEPADGELDVSVDVGEVRLEFTERLAAGTVTAAAVTIRPEGGQAVSGEVELTEGDTVVVWSSSVTLEFSTHYQVTAETSLTDRAGNHLDQDPVAAGLQRYTGFFTTMAETIPPMVTGVTPASPWPVNVHPTVLFSEPMDAPSLNVPGVVKLMTSGLEPLPISITIASPATSLTIIPAAPLSPSNSYYLGVSTAATDTLGNRLDQHPETPGPDAYLEPFTTQ
jgi:hypothetical protein